MKVLVRKSKAEWEKFFQEQREKGINIGFAPDVREKYGLKTKSNKFAPCRSRKNNFS